MPSGQEVRESRQRMGLTQSALAERLDVSLAAVQSWESDRRPVGRHITLAMEALEQRIEKERKEERTMTQEAAINRVMAKLKSRNRALTEGRQPPNDPITEQELRAAGFTQDEIHRMYINLAVRRAGHNIDRLNKGKKS